MTNAPTHDEIPHVREPGKLRYAVFGVNDQHEIYLIRAPDIRTWTFINRFASRPEARAAVARYLAARQIAKQIGCRL